MGPALKSEEKKTFEDLYEKLRQLPDSVTGEILNGELIVLPRPSSKHTIASSSMSGKLFEPFQSGNGGPGGWWILNEPEVHVDGNVFVPDIGGWRKTRLPNSKILEGNENFFELAPDWVCEVISPSSVRRDRITKMGLYSQLKIPHYWLVDPNSQTLEVFELEGEKWFLDSTYGKKDKVSAPPFEAIEFDLGILWLD